MSLLIINQEKCKQDGLCAADCPMGIIGFDGHGYPGILPDSEAMCIRCGHCVAVCPHGALDHVDVPLAACTPIDKSLALSTVQTEQFLRSRRSVRQFKDKPVERATLQRLIETARYAPTASNSQLLEWIVINDRQRLHAIAGQVIDWIRASLQQDPKSMLMPYFPVLVKAWENGVDSVLRSAPCLVVAMAPGPSPVRMVDLTLALSYLELAAPQYGLGTCWAGLLQGALLASPSLKQELAIPEDYSFHYPMMIGYAKVRYFRLPERLAPKIHWR